MSKRTQVLFALKSLLEVALPGAKVLGFDGDDAPAQSVPDVGLAIIRVGDPGEPTIDLSPRYYWYDHRVSIGLATPAVRGLTSEEALDAMLIAFGAELARDRTLGGLCLWVESDAPITEDIYVAGSTRPARGAELIVTATYGTPDPLA